MQILSRSRSLNSASFEEFYQYLTDFAAYQVPAAKEKGIDIVSAIHNTVISELKDVQNEDLEKIKFLFEDFTVLANQFTQSNEVAQLAFVATILQGSFKIALEEKKQHSQDACELKENSDNTCSQQMAGSTTQVSDEQKQVNTAIARIGDEGLQLRLKNKNDKKGLALIILALDLRTQADKYYQEQPVKQKATRDVFAKNLKDTFPQYKEKLITAKNNEDTVKQGKESAANYLQQIVDGFIEIINYIFGCLPCCNTNRFFRGKDTTKAVEAELSEVLNKPTLKKE